MKNACGMNANNWSWHQKSIFIFYFTLADTLSTLKAGLSPQLSWEKTTHNKDQNIWLGRQHSSSLVACVFLCNLCCVASPVQLWTTAATAWSDQLKAGLWRCANSFRPQGSFRILIKVIKYLVDPENYQRLLSPWQDKLLANCQSLWNLKNSANDLECFCRVSMRTMGLKE